MRPLAKLFPAIAAFPVFILASEPAQSQVATSCNGNVCVTKRGGRSATVTDADIRNAQRPSPSVYYVGNVPVSQTNRYNGPRGPENSCPINYNTIVDFPGQKPLSYSFYNVNLGYDSQYKEVIKVLAQNGKLPKFGQAFDASCKNIVAALTNQHEKNYGVFEARKDSAGSISMNVNVQGLKTALAM